VLLKKHSLRKANIYTTYM